MATLTIVEIRIAEDYLAADHALVVVARHTTLRASTRGVESDARRGDILRLPNDAVHVVATGATHSLTRAMIRVAKAGAKRRRAFGASSVRSLHVASRA